MRRAARALQYLGTGAVVVALGKVHAAFIGHYDFTGSSRFGWSLGYVVLLCVAAYGLGLPDLTRGPRHALAAAAGAAAAGAGAISVAQLIGGAAELPRFVVFGAALVLVPAWVGVAEIAAGGRSRQEDRDRIVLVATEADADALADELRRDPEQPAALVAVLGPEAARSDGARARPLVEAVVAQAASVVVLDRAAQAEESVVSQAAALHEAGVRVRTLTLFYDEWLGKLPLSELERVALMFDIGEIHRARFGRVKRLIDLVVASVAVAPLVVAVPFVALGNVVANRGPLLYRQPRVGRDGRVFTILKFRTMRTDTAKVNWTEEGDPRVTPFGRWLRRTHLDELPQVVNILAGDLSVVGPRPEQPQYVEQLIRKLPFYDMRHLVRPGLTGWAQVKYEYGANEEDALQKLQYEFYYLRHQSLGLDLRVVGRTVRSVLSRRGR